MKRLLFFLLLLFAALPAAARGEEKVATRFGGAAAFGHAYDPENIDFLLVSGVALFDYDRVWPHRAPPPLRFKVEATLGLTTAPRSRAMASGNMIALYYLDSLRTEALRPYAEAGIGLIYTDYRVAGQGLRINFNPQAGIGTEIGGDWYAAFRIHHLSNANLHRDNRGSNSLLLQIGRYF
ncbi:MAG: acyloxyacyl hydrolase [Desulfuromonadales bacterium]|jgi:hypothetical protein